MTADLSRIPSQNGAAARQIGSQAAGVEHTRAAAEVAAAVQAARMVPRDIAYAMDQMRRACSNYTLAQKAFYSYRQGGVVEGATVHLARTLAAIYGNIDWGTKELERSVGQSEVQAWAWDQESNSRKSRSIIIPHVQYTGGKKNLEGAREIDQNNNSVAARAEREMLFGIMDAGYVEEAKRRCRETLERGEGDSIPERGEKAVAAFSANYKVTRGQLEKHIGVKMGQWTAQNIASLEVLYGSLNRNEITVKDAFPAEEKPINLSDLSGKSDPHDPTTNGEMPNGGVQ